MTEVPSGGPYPLVTIGVPTFNRAAQLRNALESLLRQDAPSFEIVVSDNASPDNTPSVLAEFSARSPRIRPFRQPNGVTPPENFRTVLRMARGHYFMWAADDDDWEPSFVSTLVSHLEAHPDVVLVTPEAQYVSPSGERFPFFREGAAWYDRTDGDVESRLNAVVDHHYGNLIYGLYRREALMDGAATVLESWSSAHEIPVFLHAASRGKLQVLDTVLFYKTAPASTYLALVRRRRLPVPASSLPTADAPPARGPIARLRIALGRRLAVWRYFRAALPDSTAAIAQLPVDAGAKRRVRRRLILAFARDAISFSVRSGT